MDIRSPRYSSIFTHTFTATLEEEISDISSTSTSITMSNTNSDEQRKIIADLSAGLESVKVRASAANILVSGVTVSTDILNLHKQLTSHKLVFTESGSPSGKWSWGGLREIKNRGNDTSNPNTLGAKRDA